MQWKENKRRTELVSNKHGKKRTWNFGMLSSPGKSSMSPVWTEKQAPCHGHRTSPPHNTPYRETRALTCFTHQCWRSLLIVTMY